MNRGFLIALGIGAVAAFFLGTAFGTSEADVREEIINALVTNCENDAEFREQSKIRAEAVQELYALEQDANEALIEVVNEIQLNGTELESIERLGVVLDKVNTQLSDTRATVVVVPVPNCDDLRTILDDSQEG